MKKYPLLVHVWRWPNNPQTALRSRGSSSEANMQEGLSVGRAGERRSERAAA